jgi:hypothetical protein
MLTSKLHIQAHTIEEAGAAAIRNVVGPQDILGVLKAYQRAINNNFYLAAAGSATTFFLAFAMGLNRIGKKEGGEFDTR